MSELVLRRARRLTCTLKGCGHWAEIHIRRRCASCGKMMGEHNMVMMAVYTSNPYIDHNHEIVCNTMRCRANSETRWIRDHLRC